jgi:hypothetical protein
MANNNQLQLIKRGIDIWNAWRKQNPDMEIDLTETDLSGMNLSKGNFFEATLSETNFSDANLSDADFTRAVGAASDVRSIPIGIVGILNKSCLRIITILTPHVWDDRIS